MNIKKHLKNELIILIVVVAGLSGLFVAMQVETHLHEKSCGEMLKDIDYNLKYNNDKYDSWLNFHIFTIDCNDYIDLKMTFKENPELARQYKIWLDIFNAEQREKIKQEYLNGT